MPSASFYANFDQFDRQVEAAKSTLGNFEISCKNVQGSIKRIETAFDGSKLIGDAIKTAAAVEKIAEKGQLTEQELRKLNAQFEAAADKAGRIKQTMPDAFEKVAASVRSQLAPLDQAKNKTDLWGAAVGSVKNLAVGMVAGFTLDRVISGIGSAVVSTVDWAGSITDLSAKVGVSTTALQRWEFAANRSGNSLEEVVSAAQELSRKIADGDDSTVAALERLGISHRAIAQMHPEQQFELTAGALAKVTDQGRFTSDGIALMGKTFKTVAPTIRADVAAVGDEAERLGVVVSQDTISAMDDLGDAWGDLKLAGRGLISDVLQPMVPLLRDIAQGALTVGKGGAFNWLQLYASATGNNTLMTAGGLMNYGDVRRKTNMDLPSVGSPDWQPSSSTVINAEDWYIKQIEEQQRSGEKAAKAAAEHAEAVKQAAVRWNNIVRTSDWLLAQMGRAGQGLTSMPGLSLASADLGFAVGGGVANTSLLGWNGNTGLSPASVAAGGGMNWGKAGIGGLNAAMPWLSQLVAGGSQSGQMGGSIGGSIGGGLGSLFAGGTGIMGSIAPFLGPALGLVGGLVGKLFGPSKGALAGQAADKNIASTQASLLQQYGSLDAIAGTGDAGAALAAAWGSKNVAGEKHFNDLVAKFQEQNTLLSEQADLTARIADEEARRKAIVDGLIPGYQQMASAAQALGADIAALGPKVDQLGATEGWTSTLNAIQLLERGGAETGNILDQASGRLSMMVDESRRLGTEIPENMRPYLANLVESGRLVDANGVALKDLSGIKWGKPVETEADKAEKSISEIDSTIATLKASLLEVVDALRNLIPSAARDGAAATAAALNGIPRDYKFNVDVEASGVPALAAGGIVRRPTLALVGEAGPEAVVPLSGSALRDSITSATQMVGELRWRGRAVADVFWSEARPSAMAMGIG